MLMMLSLASCGGKTPANRFRTLGDAFAVESTYHYEYCDETNYVYVFDCDGAPFRVVAPMTKELFDQVDAVDLFDEDRDVKIHEIISPLELSSVEDLSVKIPDREKLNKMVGKTGGDLLDQGYELIGYGWGGGDEMVYTLVSGVFEYDATVDAAEDIDDEDFDSEAAFRTALIKDFTYAGVSYRSTDLSYAD